MIYRTQSSRPMRPWEGKIIGGVCARVSERFGLDVTFVRLAFLLLTLAKGFGVLLYGVLWLVLPDQGDGRSFSETVRHNARAVPDQLRSSRQRLGRAWDQADQRRYAALGLVGAGSAILLWSFGALSWLTPTRFIGLVAVLGGAAVLFSLSRMGDR